MEIFNTSCVTSIFNFHSRNISLNKCVNCNSILYLYFSKPSFEYIITKVFLKNIKTRAEYICDFTVSKDTSLIIDLTGLESFFSDYEAEIVILSETPGDSIVLKPVLVSKEILYYTHGEASNKYKWFIRTSENNNIRLSTITRKL